MGPKLRFNGCVVQERLDPSHLTVTEVAIFNLIAFLANIIWVQPELLIAIQHSVKLRMLFEQVVNVRTWKDP